MIEAINGLRNQMMALCKCDECATEFTCAAAHEKTKHVYVSGKVRRVNAAPTLRSQAQVVKKLQQAGWSFVKGHLRCPKCEEKRKSKIHINQEVATMENVTQLRQPTPKQKREIISLLELVYDDDAKRYKGKDTDNTVAETIGGGVMFGWVAAIREEMFGPDGGNEEIENLKAHIGEWLKQAERKSVALQKNLQEFDDARAKIKTIYSRLDALNKTLGPKAIKA